MKECQLRINDNEGLIVVKPFMGMFSIDTLFLDIEMALLLLITKDTESTDKCDNQSIINCIGYGIRLCGFRNHMTRVPSALN